MRRIAVQLILAVGLLTLEASAQALDSTPLPGLHGLGSVHYYRVAVEDPAREYHVYVSVPDGADAGRPLPAVYLLDGGVTFPMLTAYRRYLTLSEEIPRMLTVGISYGSATFEGGNFRSTDFTAPSSERDYWGGAKRFRQILREQIIPLVENHHPADPAKRIVFGQSLGGQFVIDTALRDPDLFHGLIASNPALHRNLAHFTDPNIVQRSSGTAPRLLVSSAVDDTPRFRGPAKQWIEFWTNKELPLTLKVIEPAGHNHFSPAPLAFREGLKWILGEAGSVQE